MWHSYLNKHFHRFSNFTFIYCHKPEVNDSNNYNSFNPDDTSPLVPTRCVGMQFRRAAPGIQSDTDEKKKRIDYEDREGVVR